MIGAGSLTAGSLTVEAKALIALGNWRGEPLIADQQAGGAWCGTRTAPRGLADGRRAPARQARASSPANAGEAPRPPVFRFAAGDRGGRSERSAQFGGGAFPLRPVPGIAPWR